jgi:hypothetical protein
MNDGKNQEKENLSIVLLDLGAQSDIGAAYADNSYWYLSSNFE